MYKRLTALVLVLLAASGATASYQAEAQVPATLKYGSTGPDVPDLQFRLQTLGYFKGSITTTFGMSTRNALMGFQRANGIAKDGIAGPRTWGKLKKLSVSRPELSKLARIIYSEARGEVYKGQVAVGAVVMNRLISPKFPKTVTGIIFEQSAFTAVADGQYWLLPNQTAFKAAREAVRGYDPTGNALFYYNPDTATSDWIRTRKIVSKIGNHVFAK
ncbi:cell wall hydrolase [Paenibacillus solisilvae]|uniref:Cell wall hydrolase n=1 Tax=Paenibacillus solisilvae TaxID=2486751 RepID=A0ABW0VYA5_9BACL